MSKCIMVTSERERGKGEREDERDSNEEEGEREEVGEREGEGERNGLRNEKGFPRRRSSDVSIS